MRRRCFPDQILSGSRWRRHAETVINLYKTDAADGNWGHYAGTIGKSQAITIQASELEALAEESKGVVSAGARSGTLGQLDVHPGFRRQHSNHHGRYADQAHMKDERIQTLHPEGKQGVNILRSKYDPVRCWSRCVRLVAN